MATREGLYEALDRFRDALAAGDPSRIEWAPALRYSENNVALEPGDGVWGTLTALGPYDLRFADAGHGQVALFTQVEESHAVSPCAIRLRFDHGAVAEMDAVEIAHRHDCPSGNLGGRRGVADNGEFGRHFKAIPGRFPAHPGCGGTVARPGGPSQAGTDVQQSGCSADLLAEVGLTPCLTPRC